MSAYKAGPIVHYGKQAYVGIPGFEPGRITHSFPKRDRYLATELHPENKKPPPELAGAILSKAENHEQISLTRIATPTACWAAVAKIVYG